MKYVCVCGYEYDEEAGDPDNGIEPGTKFEDLPEDWVCPICGLGKGAGYYDKFLSRAVNAKKIALAYDCQLVESVPIAPHDLKVDAVITPTKILEGEVKVGIGD